MKNVIAGLEEGLQAIAEALEGDSIVPTPAAADEGKVLTAGDDGSASWETPEGGIPTPTLEDESKVLKAVPQTQTTVAPEWASIREVPTGGQSGQVLTKTGSSSYGWANASGGSYPEPTSATNGQVLTADGWGGASWETPSGGGGIPTPTLDDEGKVLKVIPQTQTTVAPEWASIREVPTGGQSGQVLTKTGSSSYGWAPASGGHIDVIKFDVAKSSFTQDGQVYKAHFASDEYDILTKINSIIGITIVDNVDGGYPSVINPATDECSIWYEDGLVYLSISSTIYGALGSRQANHFYMTYYTGA